MTIERRGERHRNPGEHLGDEILEPSVPCRGARSEASTRP
jgi:hypothetical protein